MWSLLSGLYTWYCHKRDVHVLILGLDHAGKTTMLEQMKGMYSRTPGIPTDKIPPTVGMNLGRMDVGSCRLLVWDLGGHVNFRTMWERYYAESEAIIFVVDSADEERLAEAKRALESTAQHCLLANVPVLVLANKQDLETARSAREIAETVGNEWRASRAGHVQSASALTCEGIDEGVQWLLSAVLRGSSGEERGGEAAAGGSAAGAAPSSAGGRGDGIV